MKVEAIPRNMTQGTANNPNGSTWQSSKNSVKEAKTFGEIDAWIKSAIDENATLKQGNRDFKRRKNEKWVPLELFQETAKLAAITVHDANEKIQKLEVDFNNVSEVVKYLVSEKERLEIELEQVRYDWAQDILKLDELKEELATAKVSEETLRQERDDIQDWLRHCMKTKEELEKRIGEVSKILNEFPKCGWVSVADCTMTGDKSLSNLQKFYTDIEKWRGHLRDSLKAEVEP